jgi:hypothetical protein
MYQIIFNLGNRDERSQYFASDWAANYAAIQVVHANLGVKSATIVNISTGEILKTYTA